MNFFKYFLEYQHIKLGKMPLMEKGPSCRDIVYKIKQLNDLIKTVLVLASKQYLPKNIRLAKVSRKKVERKTTLMQNDYVNRQIPRYVFKHALS